MKQAAICAFLIILVSGVPEKVSGQEKTREANYPLHLYFGTENQVYSKAEKAEGELLQQHSGYTGLTLKPFPYGWFHLGSRSRFTSFSDQSGFYIEPVNIYMTSTFMAFKDFIYVTAGLRLPLAPQKADYDDSEIYGDGLNHYTPLSHPNILPLNAIQLGGLLKRSWGPVNLFTGATYIRPSYYEFIEGYQEFAAAFSNVKFRMEVITSSLFHRLDAKITNFGWEKDKEEGDQESHMEGTLYQVRYGIRFHSGPSGWGTAVGMAVKNEDESRKNIADNSTVHYNYNLQRFFSEVNWVGPGRKKSLLQAGFSPQLLYQNENGSVGYQLQSFFSFKIKTASLRDFKVGFTALYGNLDEVSYVGGKIKLGYSLRRLDKSRLYPARVPAQAE